MFERQLPVATTVMALLFLMGSNLRAQSDLPNFEAGGQFTALGVDDPRGIPTLGLDKRTEAGFGGRIAYHLNRYISLEAEINFFPRDYGDLVTDFTGGRITQGLFGLKGGCAKRSSASSASCDQASRVPAEPSGSGSLVAAGLIRKTRSAKNSFGPRNWRRTSAA